MSLDNISKIITKGNKDITYIFDLPSLEDEEAIVSYSLTISKNNIKIDKITDFNDLFNKLNDSKSVPILYQSKEYKAFITKMVEYMSKINQNNTSLNDEDIEILNVEFDEEIRKKGNTEVLKLKNKKF